MQVTFMTLFFLTSVDISYKDILGICKGLYYSLWAQDKLLLQVVCSYGIYFSVGRSRIQNSKVGDNYEMSKNSKHVYKRNV